MREKFRDSDVELRNSATTRDIDDNNSNKQLIGKSSKRYQYILISSIIFSIAALIAIIITYFLVYKNVNDQVRSISETCSNSDDAVSLLKDPPKTLVRIYPFNITNPYEYVLGATPEVSELGLYAIDLQQQRKNLDVSKSSKTISFDLWNDVSFNPSKSCSNCNADDIINVPNLAFLTLLSQVQNEAALILQATCTPTQVALIQAPGNNPYCTADERGKNVVCVCCATTPTPNATLCNTLTTQTTKPGGLLSYLAKYDDGLQLNTVPSGFALSTGAYTPLVRRMSVSQIAFGSVSAYAGMFKTASAYRNGDWDTVWENGNTTIDLRDACVLACPSVASVVQKFPSQFIAAFQNVECNGTVPSADVLVSQGGLTQERADQLRYLEGVTCRPFSVNIAVAAILTVLPANNVCSDGSSTLPCCLLSSDSTLITAAGIGCQQWVNGLVQSRRVYSLDDALAHIKPSPYTEFYSGCASGKNKFQQIYWKGESYYDEWFTPANYIYPKMPWADPVIMRKGKSGIAAGSMTIFNISGFQVAVREGRGITSNFLDYDFTNGDPKYTEEEIWSSFKLRTLNITYQKKSEVRGIQTNHFVVNIPNLTTDDEIEYAQKTGQMPYQNLENLVYALDGAPVIMSLPNWYGSNPNILTQTGNSDRFTTSTTGVNVYRTRTSYAKDSELLPTPELITEETWKTYGNQVYRGKVDIEPGTGLTLTGQIANQFSVFTWNCNPTIDPSCAIQATAQSATDPLCYLSGGRQFPCSAANVFTPKVMGGKVIPVYFLTTDPDAPDKVVNQLKFGLSIRYALSILVIIIPILAAGIAGFLGYRLYHVIKEDNESKYKSDNNNDAVLQTTFTSDAMTK